MEAALDVETPAASHVACNASSGVWMAGRSPTIANIIVGQKTIYRALISGLRSTGEANLLRSRLTAGRPGLLCSPPKNSPGPDHQTRIENDPTGPVELAAALQVH